MKVGRALIPHEGPPRNFAQNRPTTAFEVSEPARCFRAQPRAKCADVAGS